MRRTAVVWLLLFLSHGLLYREVLFSPPAYDQIGLFGEADFLYQSGFDYAELWTAPSMHFGGPKAYMTTILPTFVASLRAVGLSPIQSIAIYRLFNWACNTSLLLLLFGLMRRQATASVSTLCCMCMFFLPLWATQVEMVGMEIPSALFAVLAAKYFLEWQFGRAYFYATLAFLVKHSGIVTTAALAAAMMLHALLPKIGSDRAKRQEAWLWTWIGIALLLIQMSVVLAGGSLLARLDRMAPPELRLVTLYVCSPDLVLLWIIATIAGLIWLARVLTREPTDGENSRLGKLRTAVEGEPLYLFSWLMVLGNWTVTMTVVLHPRYLMVGIPFLFLLLCRSMTVLPSNPWIAPVFFSAILTGNVANSHGVFFPPLPDNMERVASFLERDRDYRRNHDAMLKAARTVEQIAGDRPIVVGELFTHVLSCEGLGYVERDMHGYTTLDQFDHPNFQKITQLLQDQPPEVVVVNFNEPFRGDSQFQFPPPGDRDIVVYRDNLGSSTPVIVFIKRFENSREIEDFVASLFLPVENGCSKFEELAKHVEPTVRERVRKGIRTRIDWFRRKPHGANPASTAPTATSPQ